MLCLLSEENKVKKIGNVNTRYDESLWKRLDLGGRNLKVSTFGYVIQRGVVILRLARADVSYFTI